MAVDAMFALATLSPCFIILGVWFLLRHSGRWLRLLGTGFSVFASPIVGSYLVMISVDLSAPGSRSAGAGIAALPMMLVYFLAMAAAIVAELVRVSKQSRPRSTR